MSTEPAPEEPQDPRRKGSGPPPGQRPGGGSPNPGGRSRDGYRGRSGGQGATRGRSGGGSGRFDARGSRRGQGRGRTEGADSARFSGDRGERRGGAPRDDRRVRPSERTDRWDGEERGRRRSSGARGDGVRDERRVRPADDREQYHPRPGTAPAADEPSTPTDFDEGALPMAVRAELKGLPKELADTVGSHIQAAGELIDTDPELAHRHAEAARRRAGRLPIVREAAAETAYAAGHYDVALREYRALRRMSGGDVYLPVMADCERALGRHREALELLGTLDPNTKDLGLRIECLLVEAGIRDDMGQRPETLRLLKNAISRKAGPKQGQARLRYAYADLLEQEGRATEARSWFEAAERLDAEGALDTTDRIADIDGITLPEDMSGGAWDEISGEEDPEEGATE